MTLPLMVLTPSIFHAKLPFFGVNVTSKSVALKLLFAWHGFSDEDVSMFSAAESERTAQSSVHINKRIDRAMLGDCGEKCDVVDDGGPKSRQMRRNCAAPSRESERGSSSMRLPLYEQLL